MLPSLRKLLKELGAQDAAIQLQELAIRFLRESAPADNVKAGEFLRRQFKEHGLPHGTYDFDELRRMTATSYIVLTYAEVEGAFGGLIAEIKAQLPPGVNWVDQRGKSNLAPLDQLTVNLPKGSRAALTDKPEAALIDYYRCLRVSDAHRSKKTAAQATKAFGRLQPMRAAFCETYLLDAPNPPEQVHFDDFLLFTRAVKYLSRSINELWA